MHESIEILKGRLTDDEEALTLLDGLDIELSAAALCDSDRQRLKSELEEAGRTAELALREAAEAQFENEAHSSDVEMLKREMTEARLCGLLAVEAVKAGCGQPWDLIRLAGYGEAAFDENGNIVGAPEWLKRVRAEKPWMFGNRRNVQPPLYKAGVAAAEEDGIKGILAGAARRYDGQ